MANPGHGCIAVLLGVVRQELVGRERAVRPAAHDVGEGAAASWDRVRTLLDRALADAGYGGGQVRRRDLLLGKSRTERVDRDLARAGLTPGDPRLFHEPLVRDDDADATDSPTPEQP